MSGLQLLGTEVEGRTVVQRGASETSVPMVGAKKVKGYRGSADRLSRAVVMTIKRYLAQVYQDGNRGDGLPAHEIFGVLNGPDDYPFKQNYNMLPDKAAMQYFVTALNSVTKKLKAWDFVARANEVQTRHIGGHENGEAYIYSNISGGTIYRTVSIQSTNRGALKIGPSTKRAGPILITNWWSWGSQQEHLSPEMVECLPSDWTDWVNAAFDRSEAHYGDRERLKKIKSYESLVANLVDHKIPRAEKMLANWEDPVYVADFIRTQVSQHREELANHVEELRRHQSLLAQLKGGEEE